ncbi:uncharacterized protein [Asterias amurensis]|uniref:uncharacterized protein n=1 Tax=Asterias amurensis TaxID=7602 RepID=UPI003AB3854F
MCQCDCDGNWSGTTCTDCAITCGLGEDLNNVTCECSVLTTPDVKTPDLTTPDVTSPCGTTPGSTTPDVTTPDVTTPGVTTPDLTTPGVTTPDVTTPGKTIPGVTTPDVTTTDMTTTDVPTTDVSTTDMTTTDVPMTDVPTTDVPTTDVATTDVATTDVPTPDVTTTDVPTTDVATTDVPTPDVTTTDVPTTDVPTTDVTTTDVPTTDVPTTDVPTTDVTTTDVPTSVVTTTDVPIPDVTTTHVTTTHVTTTDVPTPDVTTTDVPTTDVPTTDVPTTDVPTTDVPITDVPTPDVTTTDVPTTDVTTTDVPTPDVTTTDVTTTDVPTTDVPTTDVPTTDVTTTDVPTTDVPTTNVPTTDVPTTDVTTTDVPTPDVTTTDVTTTDVPTTDVTTTDVPTTDVTTTDVPTTDVTTTDVTQAMPTEAASTKVATTVTTEATTTDVPTTCVTTTDVTQTTLTDNEAPIVTCPTNKTTNVDSGTAGAIVSWSRSPFATDAVDATVNADSVVCKDGLDNVMISGGFFQAGETTVTCRAFDTALIEGSCAFVITVIDNESPIVTCPSAETTNVDLSMAGALVSWSVSPDAIDVVDATVNADSVVCEDHLGDVVTSGGFFQAGVTTVTCRASDNVLNNGSCVFVITVIDNVAPNVTCPMDETTNLTSGMASAFVDWSVSPDATDAVDATVNADSVVCKDGLDNEVISGGSFQVGETTVTCRAFDTALNEGSCAFVITVIDMISPTVTCPISSETLVPTGSSSAQVDWSSQPSAVDSVDCCISVSCRNSVGGVVVSGGIYNVGNNDVTCTAQDSSSNIGMCTFTVTVRDLIPPTVTCPISSETFVFPGTPSAQVDWSPQPSAVDNIDCCISVSCRNSVGGVVVSGGTFNVGDNELTCTAQDSVSNQGRCTFTVSVKVLNFVPFGRSYGDRLLSNAVQQRRQALTDLRSETFYPPNYFPYADSIFEKIYFTEDGVIIFSNEQHLQKRSFPTPGQLVFSDYEDANILAPFWADVDSTVFNNDNNVFYQDIDAAAPGFNKAAELSTISAMVSEHPDLSAQYPYFSATWALVITWVNVRPAQAIPTAVDTQYETNTFQVIIVTDSNHGFAIMNYHPSHMNWNPAMLFDSNVILGYSYGLLNEHFHVQGVSNIFKPGRDNGNSGLQGRWVFHIDKLPQNYQNPRLFCTNWASRQSFSRSWIFSYLFTAHTCPCSWTMAWLDFRFTYIGFETSLPTQGSSGVSFCFVRTFQWPWLAGPRCCYDLFYGSIIVGVRSALSASVFETYPVSPFFYRVSFYYQQWFDEEFLPRQHCCVQSNLCYIYERFRPPMSCWRYRPPFWAWFFGDPHIMTLDSVGYTFNGLGEFSMLIVDDQPTNGQKMFELQIRTKRALNTETQQLTDATYLSGFAAEIVGGERIEIKANAAADGLITTVNGEVIVPTTEGVMIGNLTVTLEENPLKVAANYIENIGFAVGINNSFCDITFRIDDEYKTRTKGLMGLWDDDTTNEALRRDGNQQPATGDGGVMTEEDYYQFGITWRITEEDSLFYYVDSESFASENDITFTPRFLDNLIAEATTAELEAVMTLCKNDKMCQFDYLATKDPVFGEAAMMINSENQAELNRATNFPPNITSVERIQVTVGEIFTLQLEASDMDGDNITFSLAEAIEGASITPEGGLFTWDVVDRTAVKLMFVASDDKSNTTMEPEVELCDCSNGGTCRFGEYVEGTNIMIDRFGVVLCDCMSGWNGVLCEVNYDACEVSPCFHTVACFDMDPPHLNRTCADCPVGLEGDGVKCRDIDECILYENSTASSGGLGCDQNCFNLLQTFNCSCNSGFSLYIDGRRCIDVDECNLQSDDCSPDAVCNNTVGSYECICNPGYTDDNGDGRVCSDINECNGVNSCDSNSECFNTDGSYRLYITQWAKYVEITLKQHIDECMLGVHDCPQDCKNLDGTYMCLCGEGFREQEDGTCTATTPCSGKTCMDSTCYTAASSLELCRCDIGFHNPDGGDTCLDVNECLTEDHDCDEMSTVCVNAEPFFTCDCKDGYQRSTLSGLCDDINECLLGDPSDLTCHVDADCINTNGSYTCQCKSGYIGNGLVCFDIDECRLPAAHPLIANCSHQAVCTNLAGSFQCNCSVGFEGNGVTCQDIKECESVDPVCASNSLCSDTEGSYLCMCNSGYRGDGFTSCVNIDECQENPDLCHSLATCTNTEGSYECNCDPGYQGSGLECTNENECTSGNNDCAVGSSQCTDNVGSYVCMCNSGYVSAEGLIEGRQCDDVNECEMNMDSCDTVVSRCDNIPGGYDCSCLSGFEIQNTACVDIDECQISSQCSSKPDSVCFNLPGSHECTCMFNFYQERSVCKPGVSYNTSAVFTLVSSVMVLNEGFDLRRHFVKYRTDLKRDIEATFRESAISTGFGDVLIYDITPIPGSDSTVLVTFATNMKNAATPEATIVASFLDLLDGSNMDQVQLNHKVIRNTLIIGAPQCDSSPCVNSGTCASDNTASDGYSCSCLAGFTGQNCELQPCVTASCQNSGTCTNDVTANTGYICACSPGFTGTNCGERAPCDDPANQCGNGGTCNNNLFANLRGYTCICLAGFLGDDCEIECTQVCSNNGELDNVLCTCTCVSPWSGPTCTECSLSCMNEGVRNDADCSCGCENIPWSGETCSDCAITCGPDEDLDTVTCECSVCPFTCQNNGVLDTVNCLCSCTDNWTGQACSECSINSCSNSGTLIDAMCQCDCDGNWAGTTCTDCSLTSSSCSNSGVLDSSTCQCGCTGSWTGTLCIECLINCENSGRLTAATCECACDEGWTGTLCTDCALDCLNGGTLDSATCQCACVQSWSGTTCSTCPITAASCMNGASFDADNCECVCSQANSGDTCAVVNPCLDTSLCTGVERYCSPDHNNQNGFTCPCQAYDGYIQVGDQCLQRPSLRVVVKTLTEFFPAFANPTSARFKNFIAIMESVLLWRLDENSTTLMAESVTGSLIHNGSAVVTATIFYPVGTIPPEAATVYVLALEANLIDDMGNSVPIRQNSVTAQDASIACTVGYCQNGGTCTRAGIFPMFTYSCSCLDSFTGDQCETDVTITTQPTTQAPTQTPDAEPLSTVAIALITVGGFVLLILISTLFLCMCILMRRQYEEGRPGKDYRARSQYYDHQQNWGFARDDSYSDQLSSDESQNSETQRRMNRLMQVMWQSPYLQRNPNQEFIRPYVVTGMEAQYHHDAMSEDRDTGLVARNPLAYRRN